MTTVKTSADPAFVDLRDDLLFQSAKADGKGWFELPNMRDLAPRGWPPAPPEPMVRKPAGPDPRDALIAELCEALDALNHIINKVTYTSGGRRYNSYQDFVDLNEKGLGEALEQASAALRRARGLA